MKYWFKLIVSSGNFLNVMFLTFLISVLGLLGPIFIIHIFNRYISYGLEGTLILLTSAAIITVIFEFLFRNIRNNIFSEIVSATIFNYKNKLFVRLFSSKVKLNESPSEVLDIEGKVENSLDPLNQSNVIDFIFGIIILMSILYINQLIGLIILFILLILLYINLILIKRKRVLSSIYSDKENLYEDLKNLNKKKLFFSRFYKDSTKYFCYLWDDFLNYKNKKFVSLAKNNFYSSGFIQLMNYLTSIIIIALGSQLVVKGDLSIGSLIGINIFSMRSFIIILNAQKSYFAMKSVDFYFKNTENFFSRNQLSINQKEMLNFKGHINIKNLSFKFQKSNSYKLINLNMQFKPGEISVISGSNCTGKSILGRLLVRDLNGYTGKILVDNQDLETFSIKWWFNQVAYLPQNDLFYKLNLFDNISINNSDLNINEIDRIFDYVGVNKTLSNSEINPNNIIDKKISPGILKKLNICRLLARSKQVYIFDDPFCSLDNHGRNFFIDLINSLRKSYKTIICLSNDSTIKKVSDNIFDLEGIQK